MSRYTKWTPAQERQTNVVEKLKAHASVLVIGVLTLVILYQGVTSRKYQSELERDKKQLASDLAAAREAQREAIDRADGLQKELTAVSDGINAATGTATDSGRLINQLKGLIGQIPEGCKCGN